MNARNIKFINDLNVSGVREGGGFQTIYVSRGVKISFAAHYNTVSSAIWPYTVYMSGLHHQKVLVVHQDNMSV